MRDTLIYIYKTQVESEEKRIDLKKGEECKWLFYLGKQKY
jgi:hypothetical protein